MNENDHAIVKIITAADFAKAERSDVWFVSVICTVAFAGSILAILVGAWAALVALLSFVGLAFGQGRQSFVLTIAKRSGVRTSARATAYGLEFDAAPGFGWQDIGRIETPYPFAIGLSTRTAGDLYLVRDGCESGPNIRPFALLRSAITAAS